MINDNRDENVSVTSSESRSSPIPPEPIYNLDKAPTVKTVSRRAKSILLESTAEWNVIDGEPEDPQLASKYMFVMALIPSLAVLFALLFASGAQGPRLLGPSLLIAASVYVLSVATCGLLTAALNLLAPIFGGATNKFKALKLSVYSFTPVWVGGALLAVFPEQILLVSIIGFLYGVFLIHSGAPRLMDISPDKVAAYAGVSAGAWIGCFLLAQVVTQAVFN